MCFGTTYGHEHTLCIILILMGHAHANVKMAIPENCSVLFPPFLFDDAASIDGLFIMSVLVGFFGFLGMRHVACTYFVPSIEVISEWHGIEANVAGAAMMGAGTSLVDVLITSLAVAHDVDVGMTPVVTSTLFKLLIPIGISGLVAGYAISISRYPLLRDASFIFIALALNAESVIYNNHTLNAAIMVGTYFIYLLVLYFNSRLQNLFMTMCSVMHLSKRTRKNAREYGSVMDDPVKRAQLKILQKRLGSSFMRGRYSVDSGRLKSTSLELKKLGICEDEAWHIVEKTAQGRVTHWSANATRFPSKTSIGYQEAAYEIRIDKSQDSDDISKNSDIHETTDIDMTLVADELNKKENWLKDDIGLFAKPNTTFAIVLWILSLPFACLHFLTIPDCRKENWESKAYILTWIMSAIYLMAYDYVVLWMLNNIISAVHLPQAAHGKTLIGLGMSFSCLYCTITLARDGYGNMAFTTALGGSIFGVLIGLGVPFLIHLEDIEHKDHSDTSYLVYIANIAASLVVVIVMLKLSDWRLTKRISVVCLVMYVVVATVQICLECEVLDERMGRCTAVTCV